MKYFAVFLVLLGALMIPITLESFAENSTDFTEADLQWSKHNYRIVNGTGTAKIILTDYDSNKIPTHAETVPVFVSSDSFPEGITLLLYETEKNSGIFERVFSLSDMRSAPSVLYAREGDTATVTYTDDTLPTDHVFSEVNMVETVLVGHTGPPLERVPASLFRIQNLQGDTVETTTIQVDEQVQLVADIENQKEEEQEFAFFVQIQDDKKTTISLSWITGTLTSLQSFSPSQSWVPQNPGTFTATIFVWESLENPSALSPPVGLEFTVLAERPVPVPEKEITITIGDPVNKKGLLPIITMEKTSNVGLLDTVTDWNFLPLNHGEWGALGDRLSWDTLPSQTRLHNVTGISNGELVQLHPYIGRNDILRTYDVTCQGEKIRILSADPVSVSIPEYLSSVSVTGSEAGLLPVNGLYTLQFASFFDQEVVLPDNAVVLSREEKRCTVDHFEFSSGKYINIVFKLESFPDDFDFQYSFGVGEKNSYDSKTELYVTDMICDDPIITPVPLTDTEKTLIWDALLENNFFQMSDFTDNCDASGNCILMEPESTITLFATADGIKKSVSYRESYIGKNGESYSRFNNIIDTLNEAFQDKEALDFLPKPKCGYQ